ncbi:hypothetical protein AW736_22725 [Termitidicoccus mucosus]|uniref:Beta-mannosidase-like galactose-binding domain-containing protein n=2 Tax=Termitidicoccus mucosus TaxID=1184151 RepID=A0A178IC01_9BACT|nr:hypothetical protein AW736_22725 [Opitutaceae bacterium TSB47]
MSNGIRFYHGIMRMVVVMGMTMLMTAYGQDDLERGFSSPPEETKPYVYWYWMSGNISKEGITRDLEAMRRVGIGAAFIGNIEDVWDANPKTRGPVRMLTEEWWQLTEHAIREGKRLGVNIGLFNSPGWSQSGGPWVEPKQAMRYVVWADAEVKGPAHIDMKLPVAAKQFEDITTLAIPAPAPGAGPIAAQNPRVAPHPAASGIEVLFDGRHDAEWEIPKKETVIEVETDTPFSARSLILYAAQRPTTVRGELQVKDASGVFKRVCKIEFKRQTGGSHPPGFGAELYGPLSIAFPTVKADHFRFVISGSGALVELELTGEYWLDNFLEKTLGKPVLANQPPWNSYIWPTQRGPDALGLVIKPDRIINLTKYVGADGSLRWDVPAGNWIIRRFGMTPTPAHNFPAAPEAKGPEIDKMSRPLIRHHYEQFFGKLLGRMPAEDRSALRYIVADSYEQGSQNWTDGFAADFQKRYGYDPIPFMPAFSGRIVDSPEMTERFLWDLRRLIADHVAYNYVGGLRDLAMKDGMRLWLENYGHKGFIGEFMQYGSQANEIGGEFWASGSGGNVELRAAASTAHVFGQPIVHAESYTNVGTHGTPSEAWIHDPWSLKRKGDWAATEGINHVVLHVYISQPNEQKPGIAAWFGIEMNRNNTWFEQSKGWIDYQRRRDYMLQQGKYVADIAYFIGEDAPKMMGSHSPALPPGHAFDDINAQAVLERLKVENGRFILPDGMSYRVLVLPPLDTMRPEVLRKIRDLVAAGGTILGSPPVRSPSLERYPDCDREVAQLAAELWRDCDGKDHKAAIFGKGRVFRDMEIKEVFAALNMIPDLRVSRSKQATIPWIHRHAERAEIYFLSNQDDADVQIEAGFRVRGLQPELWDAVTGERRPLSEFNEDGGHTVVPLTFAPRQSLFVVFRKGANTASCMRTVGENFPKFQDAGEITGSWTVHFDPQWGGPDKVVFDKLTDWTRRPENGIKHYSGTAIYRKLFDLPSITSGRRVYLDLGSVASMARIRLNGHDLGTVWCAPWRIEITKAMKSTANHLEIEVVNTWANRLIADSGLPASERLTVAAESMRPQADSPLMPAGLFGPVKLMLIDKDLKQ